MVFPECREPYNHIVNRFQDKFIDTAKFYYKRSGKAVRFVPMYIAPSQKRICLGKPISFDPKATIDKERSRVSQYLMEEITHLAMELSAHRVVPYANISRKHYPKNNPEETNV